LKQQKSRKKLKTKNAESSNYAKLLAYLSEHNLTEQEAIDRLDAVRFDPAKDFYAVLVSASRTLVEKVRSKTLTFEEDDFDKSLFLLLQAGDKINKSLKSAKLEAYPDEDESDDGETGFLDRTKKR